MRCRFCKKSVTEDESIPEFYIDKIHDGPICFQCTDAWMTYDKDLADYEVKRVLKSAALNLLRATKAKRR